MVVSLFPIWEVGELGDPWVDGQWTKVGKCFFTEI